MLAGRGARFLGGVSLRTEGDVWLALDLASYDGGTKKLEGLRWVWYGWGG